MSNSTYTGINAKITTLLNNPGGYLDSDDINNLVSAPELVTLQTHPAFAAEQTGIVAFSDTVTSNLYSNAAGVITIAEAGNYNVSVIVPSTSEAAEATDLDIGLNYGSSTKTVTQTKGATYVLADDTFLITFNFVVTITAADVDASTNTVSLDVDTNANILIAQDTVSLQIYKL